jgi:hypothetical protein
MGMVVEEEEVLPPHFLEGRVGGLCGGGGYHYDYALSI